MRKNPDRIERHMKPARIIGGGILEEPSKPWPKWYCGCGAFHTPNGGSNGNDLADHVRAVVGCHGDLQSTGNASWPLYCRARIFWRALLSGTQRSCDAPQEARTKINAATGSIATWTCVCDRPAIVFMMVAVQPATALGPKAGGEDYNRLPPT